MMATIQEQLEELRATITDGSISIDSVQEDRRVDDAWNFMLPWCDHVRDRVGYGDGEFSDPPSQSFHGLNIYSPRKTSISQSDAEAEREIKSQRLKLREALKLLAVVARVDHMTWKKLLMHCGVVNVLLKVATPEKFDGDFPARFLLELPYGKRSPFDDYESLVRGNFIHDIKPEHVLRGDLVFFCGAEQHTRSSKEYNATLTKIVNIWREKQQEIEEIPDEIEIPVTIQVSPHIARSGGGMITYAQNVLKAVRHLRGQTWPRVAKRKGVPRVTFVLESIGADLRPIPIRSELTALVENLARDGIFCSGLAFQQELGNALMAPAKRGAARKSVGKLLTSLFGGIQSANAMKVLTGPRIRTPKSPNQLELSSVNFHCEPSRSWFFERVCSAAAVNQTTSHVSIAMEMKDDNPELYKWRWQWVYYGFFSKRARQLSRLQQLTLQDVRLSGDHVDAIREIMRSECPEEDLLGLVQQEHQQGHRDVSIKAKASLRLQPMNADEDLGRNANFTLPRELRGVKVVDNNTENGWVDVLVPGFGKCQTRRSSLVQSDELPADSTGVSSLLLVFEEDPDDEVLCRFLGVIGGSLQSVTIQVRNFQTAMLERITAACPRLREIAIRTPAMEVRFQVRDSRLQNPITVHPMVPSSFEDIDELVTHFCVPKLSIARAVRRLRVRIPSNGTGIPSHQEFCVTLLGLLHRNRTVEYLDVVPSRFDLILSLLFKKYHLEKLPAAKEELPLKSKLGFLSIMPPRYRQDRSSGVSKRTRSSRCLQELDRNTIGLIFAFAATPVVRKVYFGGPGYSELNNTQFPI